MTWQPWLALPARILAPLLLALLAVVTMRVSYLAQVREYGRAVEMQERHRLRERLGVEQTELEMQLGQGDILPLRRLISGLGLYQGITHAWLVDGQGRVSAALTRLDQERLLADVLAQQPALLRASVLKILRKRGAGIEIERPGGEAALLGQIAIHPGYRLILRVDLAQPLALRLYDGRGELWRQAGITLLFAALLALLLHVLWFRRAAHLTATAAALGAGHLDARAGLGGRDELAGIGAAIDRMAADLQQRQTQLQELASVIEHSPVVAIAWRNLPGRPLGFVSENIAQWGHSRAQLLSGALHYADLIHGDDRARITVEVDEHLARGPDDFRQEYRLRHGDGHWLWIEDRTWLSRGGDGTVKAIHGVLLDISESKQAEEDLRQLNASLETRVAERTAELQVLNQSLESFVYSVSHDLKTPLRGVEGYSRLLQQDYGDRLDEEGRLFIGNIRAGIKRMNELIDDLLAYSRMDRRHLESAPLNLADAVNGALAERAADIAARGVKVDASLPPLSVAADADGLALVLRNLLENALKFSSQTPRPQIEIGAREEAEGATLWIRDNGIGFDMKYHERIFEIFQRLHRMESYPGTGIGLALVKKAMQRMGGRVWAESALGQGATFSLWLPRFSAERGNP